MKMKLLIVLLVSFYGSISAQIEFPQLEGRWCYNYYGDTGEDLGDRCYSPSELVEINGKTYSKVIYQNQVFSDYKSILYRQEGDKVYVIPQDSIDELIIYDFGLEKGDLFEVNWGWTNENELYVENVDTIITLDGKSRKRIFLSSENVSWHWIEGIGSRDGIFTEPWYIFSVSGGINFLCHSQDGVTIFSEDIVDDCSLIDNLQNVKEDAMLEVYPNPAVDEININLNDLKNRRISIYDINGKMVYQIELDQNVRTHRISNNLQKGLYFLKLSGRTENEITKKVIRM